MSCLSPKQLQTLGAEASKAFGSVPADELNSLRDFLWDQTPHDEDDPFAGPHMITKTKLAEYWRRREIANVMRGRCKHGEMPPNSFKKLSQKDYPFVLAHFVGIYNPERGCEIFMKAQAAECATVMAILEKSCRERGLSFPEYPEHICLDQFRCEIKNASIKQLWCLVFTCRNRRYCAPKDAQKYDTKRKWETRHPSLNN